MLDMPNFSRNIIATANLRQLITKIKPNRVAATFNSTSGTVSGGSRTFLSPEFPESIPITYSFTSRIYNGGATAGDTQTLTVYFLIGDTWVQQFTQSLYRSNRDCTISKSYTNLDPNFKVKQVKAVLKFGDNNFVQLDCGISVRIEV